MRITAGGILRLAAAPVLFTLLLYNLRRLLFTFTMIAPRSSKRGRLALPPVGRRWSDVLIMVPCRDEAAMIPEICRRIEQLDYPPEHMQVVLISDGSQDSTAELMRRHTSHLPGWSVLELEENVGKANALNSALKSSAFGDIIYILDADHRPQQQALRKLAPYFDDPQVAGVSGRTMPVNPTASPSAYYATVESDVHQMLTMRAKDRLNLAPALLGSNCAYRRGPLEAFGFRSGALLEDSEITMALAMAGYRLRFAPDVVSVHEVPETIQGYLKQHTRWGRGFNETARQFLPQIWKRPGLSFLLRFELTLFSLGYLDRIALLGAGLLSGLSLLDARRFSFARGWFYAALALPFLQILAVFSEQRLPKPMWARLFYVPLFFAVDLWSAVSAAVATLRRQPISWSRTQRRNGQDRGITA